MRTLVLFTTVWSVYGVYGSLLRVGTERPIEKFIQYLDDYYAPHPILDDTWAYPTHNEGLERLAERMRKDKFVVGVIGSSVAAGHDNCNYDSYEKQLERTLQPLFNHYGKTIEVRNAGEGGGCGDSFRNQIFCTRNNVGDDVDAIHYSWTYFEAGEQNKDAWHETFLRWSLLMENAPVPILMNAGSGGRDYLYKEYGKFGYNIIYLEKALKKHYNFKRAWGAIGDGMHNTTRYGADGVMFRNWHPGPLGFQLVSDAIAKVYAKALLKAVTEPSKPKYSQLLSQQDLPNPVKCDPKWCSLQEPPGCVNFEEPTYGSPQIKIVTPETDDLMPYKTLYTEDSKDWELFKPNPSTLIPRKDRNRPECQHLDYCSGYMSSEDSWITLRLPRMEKGLIYVCCANNKKCGKYLEEFEFVLDGHKIDNHNIKAHVPAKKCAQILDGWEGELSDTSGHLYLAIKGGGGTQIKLSHVIAL